MREQNTFKQHKKQKDQGLFFNGVGQLVHTIYANQDKLLQNEEISIHSCSYQQVKDIIQRLNKVLSYNKSVSLFSILRQLNWWLFFVGIFLSLGQNLIGCAGILILDKIINQLKKSELDQDEKIWFVVLIISLFLCFFVKTILISKQRWFRQSHSQIIQTQLRHMLLMKSLKIQAYCDSRFHKNKPDISQLMSVDSRDANFIYFGSIEIVTSIVTLSVIISFIYTNLGFKPSLYGVIVLIISLIINSVAQRSLNKFQRKKQQMGDLRMSLTRDVVEGIKSIKYLGWEDIFIDRISQLREKEVQEIKKTQAMTVIETVSWISLGYILLYVFLAVYSSEGNDILKQNIFTVLAFFGYIKQPLGNVSFSISFIFKGIISLRRIDSYLHQKEISTLGYSTDHTMNSISIQNKKFYWPQIDAINSETRPNRNSIEPKQKDFQKLKQNEIDSFVLYIPTLEIKSGTLNIIVGEIGSGKTALILSILNELDHSSINAKEIIGKIIVNGSIGYVSQNHWLQSKSIQQTITFGEQFDQEWYNMCVAACELDQDFQQFQELDKMIIGPGGSNLSGGQRQRIALCRAVYQKKQIYLLDDIFSSLDAHVALRVYQQVVVNLLNTYLKSTVILVTSHYKMIDFTQNNINVIYVNKGTIINNQDTIQSYLEQCISSEPIDTMTDVKESPFESEKSELLLKQKEQMNKQSQDENSLAKELQKVKHEINVTDLTQNVNILEEKRKKKNKINQIQNDEHREKGRVNLKTLILFFKSRRVIFILLHFTMSFLIQGSQMLIDFWLRDYSKDESKQSFIQSILKHYFDGFDSIFKALTITNFVIALLCGILNATSAVRSCKYIFNKLNKSIVLSHMKFFDNNPIGRIISRVSSDQNKADDGLQIHYHIVLEKLSYLVGYPIGMIIQFPWIVLYFSLITSFAFALQKRYRASSRQLTRLNSVNQGKVLTVITEDSQGLSLIRSMNKQEIILSEFVDCQDSCVESQQLLEGISIWFNLRLFMLSNSSFLVIVLSNIYTILSGNEFTGNSVALGLIYSMLFSTIFSDFMNYFNMFEQDIISLERIQQYIENPVEHLHSVSKEQSVQQLENYSTNLSEETNLIQLRQQPTSSCIQFKNVYHSYGSAIDANKKNIFALKNVSFDIKKGEKIAFCGRTGSGKTSILNTLFRLYETTSGDIFINNKNTKFLSLSSLRKQISIIPQYGFLFNSSMQDNLNPSQDLSKNEMHQILSRFESLSILNQQNSEEEQNSSQPQQNKKTLNKNDGTQNLELTQIDIESLNDEFDETTAVMKSDKILKRQEQDKSILDMQIQESGKNLSNGEKQIVNFLRIVLRETEILCLDEATSNMDPKTDKILHDELFKFSEDKTLIVITHRLENIDKFDRVFVMESGEIIESGHVSELRKIPNGFFNRLSQNQI